MIDNDVALPPEPAAKKTRARKPKLTEPNPAESLIKALKFISIAQKKSGPPEVQFSMMQNHWLVAFNGVITVATKVEEDLTACPHTTQFLDALNKCGSDLSITQLSSHTLSVKSDKFKGLIPCLTMDSLQIAGPDACIAPADNRVKAALLAVSALAVDGDAAVAKAAVLLQANTAIGTNGYMMIETYHGVDLPPSLLIPKASAAAIGKCAKNMVGFGYSPSSVTFYFEDESFIKTQLFAGDYPDANKVMHKENLNLWPLPTEFFKAVKTLQSFSKDGIIRFNEELLYTDDVISEASTYKIQGLPNGMGFNAEYLLTLEDHMHRVHFDIEGRKVYFFSDITRGVLMGVGESKPHQQHTPKPDFSDMDDDIPY